MARRDLTVSVVICTRNRPADLERTLTTLRWQNHPCAEVLVVDDSDRDRRSETEAVVAATDLPVRVLTKDVPGLTASRNVAIEHVTGDVTLFLDDDVLLRPDYLSVLVAAFDHDPELAGAGGSIDDDHDYELSWLRASLMIPGRKTGRVYPSGWSSQTPRGRTGRVEHLIGCNMAYRTSVLSRYRFADDFAGYALGEDLEFSHRLHLHGHRLAVLGGAHLWHLTGLPRHDLAWGYRETVIRPLVAGARFNRLAFVIAAFVFAGANVVRNRERARGNLLGIADVLRARPPRDLHTLRKELR